MKNREIPPVIPGRIAVVGPCAAGKSELVMRLQALGYDAHQCAQEHSYVPDMWRRLTRPEVLIYLDASLPVIVARRKGGYNADYLTEQRRRLAHARAHCDIYVQTDLLDLEDVLRTVLVALAQRGIRPSAR